MSSRVPITVRLESFEGPLDLLLYLIQSHELDISKVSISNITDQYLAYVRLMQELNFDVASEFLVMAATLLHWKSKALLPQEKSEGDALNGEDAPLSQEDLIRQLIEHQRFLAAGENLAQLPQLNQDVFTRNNRRPPIERIWKEMNITALTVAYQKTIAHARKRKQILKKETVSLTEKMQEFGNKLSIGKLTELRQLLSIDPARPEIVVTFLASLELSRLKKARLHQEQVYGDIYLELLESLVNFDFNMASGFDQPAAAKTPDATLDSEIIPASQETAL